MEKLLTVEQTRKVNELSVNMGHSFVQMRELAGYHLARFTIHRFPPHSHPKALVVCGTGNNGAVGLVAAKHLSNAGHEVSVYLKSSENILEESKNDLEILKKMNINFVDILNTKEGDVILDCLIGIGLDGELYPDTINLIKHLNDSGKPLISLDIPSGMNPDTGDVDKVAVRPDHTVCVAGIKKGLNDNAKAGVVHVYDIGIPRQLYSEAGVEYPF